MGPLAVQQLVSRAGPTPDQWIEQRYAIEHAEHLAQSTRDRDASVYACRILPTLGDLPVAA